MVSFLWGGIDDFVSLWSQFVCDILRHNVLQLFWWHLHVFRSYVIILMLVYVHADPLMLFLHLVECLFFFCVLLEVVLTIWKCVLLRMCVFFYFLMWNLAHHLRIWWCVSLYVLNSFFCMLGLIILCFSIVSQPMAQFISEGSALTLISIGYVGLLLQFLS